MKKIISLIILAIFIVGCGNTEVDDNDILVINTDSSSYDHVVPYENSYNRFFHSSKDYKEIGQGLVEISKDYFPTDEYDLKEGIVIRNYNDDYHPLVKLRESTDNPYGLNPERSLKLKVNETTEVSGPFLVSDIYEIDFVAKEEKNELAGVSLALVLNKTIFDGNGSPILVDDKVLYSFGTEVAGPKLESYLRKKPELANIPIVITIFVSDVGNQSVPGNFIAEAQYQNRQGQFKAISHKWAIFPTPSGRLIDGYVDEQISKLKRSVNEILAEDIGIVAYGEFKDNQLVRLNIDVSVQTKTYTEILALTNYIAQAIKNMEMTASIRVEMSSMSDTLAVIVKGLNSTSIEIIMM